MNNRPNIPPKTQLRLWVLSGSRCQYEGCNEPLWRDELTMTQMNTAYVAHIIAATPDGPRGDKLLSPKLAKEISNLMLLCDKHHRLIDYEGLLDHPVERLNKMKRDHETRIELLTSLKEDKKSHIILYGAKIGEHNTPLTWKKAAQAMVPLWYPAEPHPIEIGLRNSSIEDHEDLYWKIERQNLRTNLYHSVCARLGAGGIDHLSIFALAPQPLLIELGCLLSDITAAEVYQLHREPPDWLWQNTPDEFDFIIGEPNEIRHTVALNLSLSATIDDSRIHSTLPKENLSIWRMTIQEPNNDFMKSKGQLKLFRQRFRLLLDRIKACHGQDVVLHVFPAVPVSVAVEIGRVWMPKADLPLCIYDQNRKLDGFAKALEFPEDTNQEV